MNWSADDIDLFQDTFPENGLSEGTGRLDAAVDIAPPGSYTIQPGDSATVMCSDPLGSLIEPEPISGFGSAVYCYISISPQDQPGKKAPAELEENNFRWPLVDSLSCMGKHWYQFRCDTVFAAVDGSRLDPVKDKWCIDINDHVITNGDTLEFFFGASSITHTTYWSKNSGATHILAKACAAPMEMQVLPDRGAKGGEILYVNNSDSKLIRQYYDWAFQLMGIEGEIDRYDKRKRADCRIQS